MSVTTDTLVERDLFGHERRIAGIVGELRAEGDHLRFTGHAAVFNKPAHIGPSRGGFIERIAPGAFKKAISEGDVRLLINHDPSLVLARTASDTLRLSEDGTGLKVEADLAPTSYGNDLAVSLKRGDVSQMSFAFEPVKDEWNLEADPPERTLREVKLFDVSAVTFPAYQGTDASLRMLRSLGIDPDVMRLMLEQRGVIAYRKTATSDGAWDGPEMWKRVPSDRAVLRTACAFFNDADNADAKTNYSFIHHMVSAGGAVGSASLQACSQGIGVLNGARGGTVLTGSDRQGVYDHLAHHIKDAGNDPPLLRSMRAGDEPLVKDDDAEPVMSHSTITGDAIARRYRALATMYGFEVPEE